MPCDYLSLPHQGIKMLSPYVPGQSAEEVAEQFGILHPIKLASNENPLGCSPLVETLLKQVNLQKIAAYPAPFSHPLRAKLAQHLGVDTDMISLGNGSDHLFALLITLFALHRDRKILVHDYGFMMYAVQAKTLGVSIHSVPVKSNWEVDVDLLIKACNEMPIGLIFIANPNNPTGLLIPHHEIQRLLSGIPDHVIVVIDEAYYEYAYPSHDSACLALLNKHRHLVVTRTFSKAYGLAGLRVGYAISDPTIAALIQRVTLPFAVNQLALEAGLVALDDPHFLSKTIENNQVVMDKLEQGLTTFGLTYQKSACNFITVDFGQESINVHQTLLRQGVIVRPLAPYGLPNYLRISIGTVEQNAKLLDILGRVINS